MARRRVLLCAVLSFGCGGSHGTSSDGGTDAAAVVEDAALPSDAALAPVDLDDVDAAGLTNAQRTAAVTQTTQANTLCTQLGDFYWEIGDATGTLGSGAIGTTYTASKAIAVASASKFVFGAYMIQSTSGQLTDAEKQELRMLSGYYGLDPTACTTSADVTDCLNAGTPGPNYKYSAADVGSFYYGGAHDEFFAATPTANGGLGLGPETTAQLNALVMPMLGSPGFTYKFPEFAGGISSTPTEFATFLRAIVANQLLLHDYLGVDAVCTLPSACANSIASPIPLAWHYSYNHWVEDDATGDGTFSSAGAYGFYPWITADKSLYGVLAREDKTNGNDDGDTVGPGYASAACGLVMRKAWSSGQAQ